MSLPKFPSTELEFKMAGDNKVLKFLWRGAERALLGSLKNKKAMYVNVKLTKID